MFIEIDNLKIEYDYKRISDKTLIFLHGFGGNLNNFSYFANLFANFGYSTLNINLTDYGFKTTPKSFNIYDFALVIKKLINRLKIVDFAFIGHSFGGRLAIILSGLHNMGEKLVLVDSAGIRPRFNLITKIKILEYKICRRLVEKKLLNKKCLDKFGSQDYKTLNDNQKELFKKVVNEDLTYLLKNINSKTLIIFGKKDKDTPIYMAKKLNKKIKNSKIILFNGGHYCYLEEREKFIRVLKEFLGE